MSDYHVVNCSTCREIHSAALDGEATGPELEAAAVHRRACAACDAAVTRMEALRLPPGADVPDLAPTILAATRGAVTTDDQVVWRWGLVFVAVAQLLAAAAHVGAGHVLRDQAAWEAALAAGFAGAAWRPDRSTGLIPVAAVLSVLLLANGGTALSGGGVHHLLAPVGTLFLVLVSRHSPRPLLAT